MANMQIRNLKQALSNADFVQENVPERPDLKAKVFAQMDELTPPESILLRAHLASPWIFVESRCVTWKRKQNS